MAAPRRWCSPTGAFPPQRARLPRANRPPAAAALRAQPSSSRCKPKHSRSPRFCRFCSRACRSYFRACLIRRLRPYSVKRTVSRPICEVKPLQATSVLRWGTTWESVVPQAPLFVPTGHDDPRRYGARTSNPWSARALGVRLLLRGVPELPALSLLFLFRQQRCRCSAAALPLLALPLLALPRDTPHQSIPMHFADLARRPPLRKDAARPGVHPNSVKPIWQSRPTARAPPS